MNTTRVSLLAAGLALFPGLYCSAVIKGDGSLSAPYRNAEVTYATLDKGGSAASPVYNLLTGYTSPLFDSTTDFTMGAATSWNQFMVKNGATLDALALSVGGTTNYNGLTLYGKGVDDNSTLLTVQGNVYVGSSGTGNSIAIGNGSDAVFAADTSSPYSLYLGYLASAPASTTFSCSRLCVDGAGTTLSTSQVIVGNNTSGNMATFCNGARVSSRNVNIGASGSRCNANSVVLTDDGSEWDMSSSVYVGYGSNSENWLLVANGALLKNDNGWSFTSGNFVGLAGGFIAFKGDKATALNNSLTSAYNIFVVWDDANHVWNYGRTSNVSVTYYDATQEADAFAATGIAGLAGYTVVHGGDRILPWAEAVTRDRNWYDSPWYGEFYTEISPDMSAEDHFSRWIWHENHGWQYLIPLSAGEVAVWDDASSSWVYVNRNYYPLVYSYADNSWYYYIEGTAPQRWFWSYGAQNWVQK